MQQATDVLGQVEARLEALGHRDGAARVETWSTVSPSLVGSGVALPRDVPAWLWGLGLDEQDRLLRALVHFAQTGDEPALLVVVACLRPGLLRLAGRTGLPVDDIVVEAAAVVLECPVERRRRVAAGLVMDVRHRFWVAKHTKGSQAVPREPKMVHAGPDELLAFESQTRRGLQAEMSAGEQLAEAVVDAWRAGHIDDDDARLIIETRVWAKPSRRRLGAAAYVGEPRTGGVSRPRPG